MEIYLARPFERVESDFSISHIIFHFKISIRPSDLSLWIGHSDDHWQRRIIHNANYAMAATDLYTSDPWKVMKVLRFYHFYMGLCQKKNSRNNTLLRLWIFLKQNQIEFFISITNT